MTRVRRDGMRGNSFRPTEGRVREDVRKRWCIVRAVRRWSRLSREAVAAPWWEVSKVRLEGARSNPMERETSLPVPGGWMGALGTSLQPKPFHDSVYTHVLIYVSVYA